MFTEIHIHVSLKATIYQRNKQEPSTTYYENTEETQPFSEAKKTTGKFPTYKSSALPSICMQSLFYLRKITEVYTEISIFM